MTIKQNGDSLDLTNIFPLLLYCHQKMSVFLRNLNLNKQDDINTYFFYEREIIIVWIGVSGMVDGVWPGKGLKVTEALKFKPERFEHMKEVR